MNGAARQWLALSLLTLAACGGDMETPDSEATDVALVGSGDGAGALPAVGIITDSAGSLICTATLINSRAILTAAHCNVFDDTQSRLTGSRPSFSPPHSGMFFTPSRPGAAAVEIGRQWDGSKRHGANDVAVWELLSDIAPEVASPLQIAHDYPPDGAHVTVYGAGAVAGKYVCNGTPQVCVWQGLTFLPTPLVQMVSDTWRGRNTESGHSCAGDSGGPTLNSAQEIVAVASGGSCSGRGADVKADVVANRRAIENARAIYGRRELCTACIGYAFRTNGDWYLQAADGGGGAFTATGTEVDSTTTLRLVWLNSGYFALQTESGHFVSARGGGGAGMTADQETIGLNEVFFSNDNDYRSLRTMVSKHWVSAEGGGGGEVNANRSAFGPWETFSTELP